jgi:hypothetical protein
VQVPRTTSGRACVKRVDHVGECRLNESSVDDVVCTEYSVKKGCGLCILEIGG